MPVLLAVTLSDDYTISGIWLSGGAGGKQDEPAAIAFILVRLMPGIDANYSRNICRAQMVHKCAHAIGNYIKPAFPLKGFEGRRHGFHFGTRARCLFVIE